MRQVYISSYLAGMNARAELRDKSTDLSIHLSELSQYQQYPRIEQGGSASDSTGTEKVCVSVALISFHSSQDRFFFFKTRAPGEGLAISVQTLIDHKVESGEGGLLPSSTRTGPGRAF
jgi:hypothetical protein